MAGNPVRRDWHAVLHEKLGTDPADKLLDVLAPLERGELARQSDLLALRVQFFDLQGEVMGLRGEVVELRGEMVELQGEMVELRGSIERMVPKFLLANLGMIFAGTGLMLAAVKLA